MGLDISVYLEIEKCDEDYGDDYDRGYEDGAIHLTVEESFKDAADGYYGWYTYDSSDGFRAGSYGGYNFWRANLAKLIGKTDSQIWENPEPGPFVELINFSDAEGTIGPKTSDKLAKDFADWHERAIEFSKSLDDPDSAKYFISLYEKWMNAFTDAAEHDGVITFH